MQRTFTPSNVFVRGLYCLGLTSVCLGLYHGLYSLLAGVAYTSWNIVVDVPWLFSLIRAASFYGSDAVSTALVAGELGGGAAMGLVLFEATRLIERELLLESRVEA